MLNRCLLFVSLMAAASCAALPDGPGDCIFAYNVTAPSTAPIAVGDSLKVTAQRTSTCSGKLPVTWSMDPQGVARVRSTGDSTAVVTGVSAGVTSVTARNGGDYGFFLLTVR